MATHRAGTDAPKSKMSVPASAQGDDRCLLVFGDHVSELDLTRAIVRSGTSAVDVFPLTSDWAAVSTVTARLGSRVATVHLVDSARLIARENESLQNDLPAWSGAIGDRRVGHRTVKEHLMTADDAMSAFWLGAIGERVLGKVPEFLLVAQVRAIHRHMIGTAYRTCVLAMDDLLARRVLTDLMRAHGSTVWLTSTESRRTAGGSLRRLLERPGRAAAAGKAIAVWLRCCLWGLLARKLTLQPDAWRSESEPLLFMSYFPYVDRAAAARGQFRNRYALPLQDLLRKEAQPVWWACHFVFIDGFGFRDAVTLCRKFVTHGERIAMVEGYFKPAAAWRALRAWVKLTWRARGIEKELGSAICEGLLPTSARALARQLWVRSYE
ncbi:MAG TPA: hypothetical protein VGY54_27445, partial [Polyangiaceae bacterium]|nr:hypothetical protein [Polyangiaceae bacterium]